MTVDENWALQQKRLLGRPVDPSAPPAFWTGRISVRRQCGKLVIDAGLTRDSRQALIFFSKDEAQSVRGGLSLTGVFAPVLLERTRT